MNKPRPIREGFLRDDEDLSPFEQEPERKREDLSPLERSEKTIEHRPPPSIPPPTEDKNGEDKTELALGKPVEWPFTYKLQHRPLTMGPHTITELTFREPSAGDVLDYGNPVNIEFRQIGRQVLFDVHIDDNKMLYLLGNLCTDKRVQGDHLKAMDVRDYTNIAHKLRRFFRPDWEWVSW